MLADIRYWENDATNKHYAIAHFNVWNAEMLMGVIDAAEEAKSPIIISFGTGFVGNTSFEDFSHMMVSMAQNRRKANTARATCGLWTQGRIARSAKETRCTASSRARPRGGKAPQSVFSIIPYRYS